MSCCSKVTLIVQCNTQYLKHIYRSLVCWIQILFYLEICHMIIYLHVHMPSLIKHLNDTYLDKSKSSTQFNFSKYWKKWDLSIPCFCKCFQILTILWIIICVGQSKILKSWIVGWLIVNIIFMLVESPFTMFALFGNEDFGNNMHVLNRQNYCNPKCNDQWKPFATLLLDGFRNIPLIPHMQIAFLWTCPWVFEP